MKILAAVYNEIDYDGRVQRAAEALADIGEVVVVSLDSGRGYVNQRFSVWPVRVPRLVWWHGLRHAVFWVKLWLVAAMRRPDMVHAHDFFLALPGWVAAKLCGARLVYDAHELIIPEPGVAQSRRDRFWYRAERWVVRRADLVIAANPERARLMTEHYGLLSPPLVVRNIPPMPARTLSTPEILTVYPQLRRRTPDECLVVYQGDMRLERRVGDFVAAFRHLTGRFRLVLVGGGPHIEDLRDQVRGHGLEERVLFTGRVPRDHLHDMLRQCDIGIVTYPAGGLNNQYCSPNKVYEYAQSGLAILCRENLVLDALLKEHPIGVSVSNPRDIAPCLRDLSTRLDSFQEALGVLVREASWDDEAVRLRDRILRISGMM